jgi:hypothetical protein
LRVQPLAHPKTVRSAVLGGRSFRIPEGVMQ